MTEQGERLQEEELAARSDPRVQGAGELLSSRGGSGGGEAFTSTSRVRAVLAHPFIQTSRYRPVSGATQDGIPHEHQVAEPQPVGPDQFAQVAPGVRCRDNFQAVDVVHGADIQTSVSADIPEAQSRAVRRRNDVEGLPLAAHTNGGEAEQVQGCVV